MKFLHLADCHIGGWRNEKMQSLNLNAFTEAIELAILHEVNFVLISGDLFNTSLPTIDALKYVVTELKKLKNYKIPVYVIPGSHDFSPSGKTMLDVLEEAELFINVFKGKIIDGKLSLEFTNDKNTQTKIVGIIGKKGMLEKKYYETLNKSNLEAEEGFKIFMFHTALTELKTKELDSMDSINTLQLPSGFNYYAGGHVHIPDIKQIKEKLIVFPGPTFPNNFLELEKLKTGSVVLYEDGIVTPLLIQTKKVESIIIDEKQLFPETINKELEEKIDEINPENKIITIRIRGVLEEGKTTDILINKQIDRLYRKGAYFVLKNISGLRTKDFISTKITKDTIEEIEAQIIEEDAGQVMLKTIELDKELIKKLIKFLAEEKLEGEKNAEYEIRVLENVQKELNID